MAGEKVEGQSIHGGGGALGVGEGDGVEGDSGIGNWELFLPDFRCPIPNFRQRHIQNLKNALRRADAVHPGVEAQPEQAQRQVEIGRENQDKEGGEKFHSAVEQTEADFNGDDGGGKGRQQFQGQRGEEGDPQDLHGHIAVALGDVFDDLGLAAGLVEGFEGRQALEHIVKVRREPPQRLELAAGQGLAGAADQDHEKRDERGGQQENHARERVERKNEEQHRERNGGRQDDLRQILAEVGFEGFDAVDGREGQFAGAFGLGVGRAERRQVADEPFAQVGFDALGDQVGGDFGAPDGGGFDDDHAQQCAKQAGQGRARQTVQKNVVDDQGEDPGLENGQQAAAEAKDDRQNQGQVGGAGEGEQALGEHGVIIREEGSVRSEK